MSLPDRDPDKTAATTSELLREKAYLLQRNAQLQEDVAALGAEQAVLHEGDRYPLWPRILGVARGRRTCASHAAAISPWPHARL